MKHSSFPHISRRLSDDMTAPVSVAMGGGLAAGDNTWLMLLPIKPQIWLPLCAIHSSRLRITFKASKYQDQGSRSHFGDKN